MVSNFSMRAKFLNILNSSQYDEVQQYNLKEFYKMYCLEK